MKLFNFFKKKEEPLDYESTLSCNGINSFNMNIKLLVITDTHGDLALSEELQLKLKSIKNYDLCCVLGDIYDYDWKIILDNVPKDNIVALLGNHDRFSLLSEYGIKDFNGQTIEINGVKIGGIQGSYKYKLEEFPSFTYEESIKFMNYMPYVDILLSHDKPYTFNYHDPAHDGLKGITKYLYDKKVPLVLHGHIHKSYEDKLKNGTIVKGCYLIELINIKNGIIEKL